MTTYCGRCGEPREAPPADSADAVGGTAYMHSACDTALLLEPPRYCTRCRRRMVVQVVPTGWTARCSEHGDLGPDSS